MSKSTKTKERNLTVEEAGKMGGKRVRELVREGKEHEEE